MHDFKNGQFFLSDSGLLTLIVFLWTPSEKNSVQYLAYQPFFVGWQFEQTPIIKQKVMLSTSTPLMRVGTSADIDEVHDVRTKYSNLTAPGTSSWTLARRLFRETLSLDQSAFLHWKPGGNSLHSSRQAYDSREIWDTPNASNLSLPFAPARIFLAVVVVVVVVAALLLLPVLTYCSFNSSHPPVRSIAPPHERPPWCPTNSTPWGHVAPRGLTKGYCWWVPKSGDFHQGWCFFPIIDRVFNHPRWFSRISEPSTSIKGWLTTIIP